MSLSDIYDPIVKSHFKHKYGGSSNSDTSDATATAGDILNGKTAYVNGEKVEGTIARYSGEVEVV